MRESNGISVLLLVGMLVYARLSCIACQLHDKTCSFFLHGEGPRSRCCGRTTALRIFVQPCDEDKQFFTKFYK
jgi:hypothetical protein